MLNSETYILRMILDNVDTKITYEETHMTKIADNKCVMYIVKNNFRRRKFKSRMTFSRSLQSHKKNAKLFFPKYC